METEQIKKIEIEGELVKTASSVELLNERVIYLNCRIDNLIATQVIEDLLKLDKASHKEITMYINSEGGIVSEGMAIYDIMNFIKSPITTIGIGRVASMATVLLASGTKRYALPNTQVMIHEVSAGTNGKLKVTEMQEYVEYSTKVNEQVLKLLSKHTKQPMKRIKKDSLKDTYFNSSECLAYGLVDKILENE